MLACAFAYVRTHVLMCICTRSGDGLTISLQSHWGYHLSRECVLVCSRTHKTRRMKRPAGAARLVCDLMQAFAAGSQCVKRTTLLMGLSVLHI